MSLRVWRWRDAGRTPGRSSSPEPRVPVQVVMSLSVLAKAGTLVEPAAIVQRPAPSPEFPVQCQ
jgi:hypothetical protein